MANKNFKAKSILLILGIIFLTSYVSAFAVSSQYWEQNPVQMYPGETKEVEVVLQNLVGESDILVKAELNEEVDIAKIIGNNEILVPKGEKKSIKVEIKISESEIAGDRYNLKLTFSTQAGPQAGNVGFASSIERDIPIILIEKPAEETKGITGKAIAGNGTNIIWIIIILLILVIIAAVIWRKKKQKQPLKKYK